MTEILDTTEACKPALDASDAAELIRARRASPQQLKKLLKFHRDRGVSDREIIAAMAASPVLVDAIGRGRRQL